MRHQGSCHCGAVRFEAEIDDVNAPMACNCSMCGRAGTWLVFVPEASFHLLQGEEALQDYQFAKEHLHHPFCNRCGIKPFAFGPNPDGGGKTYAVNVRCLHEVELQAMQPSWYDGRSL